MSDGETMELEVLNDNKAEENEELGEDANELSALRSELDALRQELAKRDELEKAQARMNAELSEFADYFPEVRIESVSDEIWEQVKGGASLSAAYALLLRKNEMDKKKIGDFNANNRRMSAGSLMRDSSEKYYSPSEVKKMTPAQVRSNYDDIIASMKHWN